MMLAAPDAVQQPPTPNVVAAAPSSSILRDVLTSVLTAVLTAIILEKVLRRGGR